MSFTAKPQFTGLSGNVNASQSQQQSGQQPKPHGDIPIQGFPASAPVPNPTVANSNVVANHPLPQPGSVTMTPMNRQQFQQQQQQFASLQQTLFLHQQQQQLLQQIQQHQQSPSLSVGSEPLALTRAVSEFQKQANGNNTNVALQQQLAQMQAQKSATANVAAAAAASPQLPTILNILQAAVQQQKPFQQQQVPLPSNTTITPVSRANQAQSLQGFPKTSNASPVKQSPNKSAAAQNSPVRRNPAATVPSPSTATTNLLNATVQPFANTLKPVIPTTPPGLSVTLAKSSPNTASATALKATVTDTTPSPSKPLTTPATPAVPIGVNLSIMTASSAANKTSPAPATPPQNKTPSASPAKPVVTSASPTASTKTNAIAPATTPTQKLSTSPRTKQTPRKNSNPIKATPTSIAEQAAKQLSASPPKGTASSPVKSEGSADIPANTPKSDKPKTQEVTAAEKTVNETVSAAKPLGTSELKKPDAKTSAPTSAADKAKGSAGSKANVAAGKIEDKKKTSDGTKSTTEAKSSIETSTGAKTAISKATDAKATSATVPAPPATKKAQPPAKGPARKPKETTPKSKPNNDAATKTKSGDVTTTPKAKASASTSATSTTSASTPEPRTKRNRLKTVPYQSPLPEIELISKLSVSQANNALKSADEKLVLFYRNEFLAVRNAEGSFFLCQALQNVYKTSPKIRIRWLSEEKPNGNVYGFDFYDHTDIECVLTTVSLEKADKGKYQLVKSEKDRIESILKKAIDVEKGVLPRPDVTEENPDGLDLSLYKDESQIEKKTPGKRKAVQQTVADKKTPAKRVKDLANGEEDDIDDDTNESDDEYQPSAKKKSGNKKVAATPKAKPKQKVTPKLSAIRTVPAKVQATPQSSRRSDVPSTPDTSKVTKAATTEKGPAVKRKLIESPNVPNKKKDNDGSDAKVEEDSPPMPKQKVVAKTATAKSPVAPKETTSAKSATTTSTATVSEAATKKSTTTEADDSKDGDSSANRPLRRNRV